MILLILGVLLFAGVHFVPSLLPSLKASWEARLGDSGFKGIFSLLLLFAFALMIFGWRSAEPAYVYALPASMRSAAFLLMGVALWLFLLSNRPSRVTRVIRHPQLSAVVVWGFAHLLVNGDSRSLVLFLGLAVWALGEMVAINRREGAWVKSEPPPWSAELVNVAIAAVVYIAVAFAHPWLSGVAIM